MYASGPVVVGVDGSPESRAAVDLAGWEAHRRRSPLYLVQAAADPQRARERLEGHAWRLHDRYPELCTTTTVGPGDPGTVLVDRSRTAALVVVGARGLGSFHSMLPGSVAVHLARHSQAPVVLVRRPVWYATRARSGVVVWIAASGKMFEEGKTINLAIVLRDSGEVAGSMGLVLTPQHDKAEIDYWIGVPYWNRGYATEAHGTDLTAVCAWTPGPGDPHGAADRLLGSALGGWPDKYPQVELFRRIEPDRNPLRAVLEAAADADLVVCGDGPVAAGLVEHAETSVAVVR